MSALAALRDVLYEALVEETPRRVDDVRNVTTSMMLAWVRHFAREQRAVLRVVAGHWGRLREAEPVDEVSALWEEVMSAQEDLTPIILADFIEHGQVAMALGHEALSDAMGFGAVFDAKHPEAVSWASQYSGNRLKGVGNETRAMVRARVVKAVANGDSYADVAKDLKAMYAGFGSPSPLLHIRSRAELIAVTEMAKAYSIGELMVAKNLKASGLGMEKAWLVVGDLRTCPICNANGAGGWIEVDKDFPSGHGASPAHPGCRCALQWRKAPKLGPPTMEQSPKLWPPAKPDSVTHAKALISAGEGPTSAAVKLNKLYPGEDWNALKVTHLKQKMQKQGLIPHSPVTRVAKAAKPLPSQGMKPVPGSFKPGVTRKGVAQGKAHLVQGSATEAKASIASKLSTRLARNADWDDFVRRNSSSFSQWHPGDGSYNSVSGLIQRWASTSADRNPQAIAMQLAAHEEFGLSAAARRAIVGHLDDAMRASVEADLLANGAGYRVFLRAMYEQTQAELAAEGITELSLYRGQALTDSFTPGWATDAFGDVVDVWPSEYDILGGKVKRVKGSATATVDAELRPLSSFTPDLATARRFSTMLAEGNIRGKVIIHATVPASRVIGTARTGFGSLSEWEMVLLDTPGQVQIALQPY